MEPLVVAVAFPRENVLAIAVPVKGMLLDKIPLLKAVLVVAEAEAEPAPEMALAVAEIFALPMRLMKAVPEP